MSTLRKAYVTVLISQFKHTLKKVPDLFEKQILNAVKNEKSLWKVSDAGTLCDRNDVHSEKLLNIHYR